MKKILFLLLLCFSGPLLAQPVATAAKDRVQIIKSDRATIVMNEGLDMRFLAGEVRLFHRDAFVLCDSAVLAGENLKAYGHVVIIQDDTLQIFSDSLIYKGVTREADLFGEVALLNGGQRIFSRRINYLLNQKLASYTTRSTLSDAKTNISSNKGQYFVKTSDAFFRDSVIVEGDQFALKTDSLRYSTKGGIAFFLGPTLILQDSAQIYTEGGFYDTKLGKAEFIRNPQYQKGSDKASADTMFYDKTTKTLILEGRASAKDSSRTVRADKIIYDSNTGETTLAGKAYYKDAEQEAQSDSIRYNTKTKSLATRGRAKVKLPPQEIEADLMDYNRETGIGFAAGNVVFRDSSQDVTLYAAVADYNRNTEFVKAYGGRPLMATLLENDTLWVSADTFLIERQIDTVLADSVRLLRGYKDVRMFSVQYQGLADSIVYSGRDSVFTLYKNPILWVDSSQFVGDTILLFTKNKQADKMQLRKKGFIVTPDQQQLFNQVKGELIEAFFVEGVLTDAKVTGSAASIFLARDESEALIGLNRTTSGDLLLHFIDNKVTDVRLYGAPEGNLSPLRQVESKEQLLPDFKWRFASRPTSVLELRKAVFLRN